MLEWHSKARDLRTKGMTVREISVALGKPYQTVRDVFRGYPKSPDVVAEPKAEPKPDKKQAKQIEALLNSLERARKPRVKIKAKSTPALDGDFSRIIFGDTHGCKADTAALAALLADISAIKPKEIVMLGDHLDCGGFLAQHHTIGYVAETEYTFEDDVTAANQLLDEVQKRAPGASIYYLEGNHERRLERWCVTQALANRSDSNYLRRMFSAESVLSLEQRGIQFFKQGMFYHGLRIPATIKLGK